VDSPTDPKCRYCARPATHFCKLCSAGRTDNNGFYCRDHASQHNRAIEISSGTGFAVPIQDEGA
jgi:hypothetical protein